MNVDDNAVEQAYLDEVERAVAARDVGVARQIRAEIAAHIAESRADAEQRGERADIQEIIAEIGDPLAVAAEVTVSSTGTSTIRAIATWKPWTYVWVTCLAIAFGTSLYFVGLVLGMVMMWTSSLWTRRVKVWATVLVPACVLLAFVWFDFTFVAAYLAPLAIAVLLLFGSAPWKTHASEKSV